MHWFKSFRDIKCWILIEPASLYEAIHKKLHLYLIKIHKEKNVIPPKNPGDVFAYEKKLT